MTKARNKAVKKLFLMCLVLVCLTGCKQHRVEEGVIRDTLFSVERTKNGFWRIWMTHDDIAGYCTNDGNLGLHAMDVLKEHDGEVLVYFRDIEASDPEFSWWSESDCGYISTGTESGTHMFMFYELSRVPSR